MVRVVTLLLALSIFSACDYEDFYDTEDYPSLDITPDYVQDISPEGGEIEISLRTNRNWYIKGYDEDASSWLSISQTEGEASREAQTTYLNIKPNNGVDRSARLHFYGGLYASKHINIYQRGMKGEIRFRMIGEMLDDHDTTAVYRIQGRVLNDLQTTDSFYLRDESGTVLVTEISNIDKWKGIVKKGGRVSVVGQFYNDHFIKSQIESFFDSNDEIYDVIEATVADFYWNSAWASEYQLRGKVAEITDDRYGCFNLADHTGVISVNGLTATDVPENDMSFKTLGIKEGDIVTIVGERGEYEGRTFVESAYYVMHEGPRSVSVKEFLDAEIGDQWYKLTGTVKNVVNTIYGNFDLVDDTGSIYVYGLSEAPVAKHDMSFGNLGIEEGDIVTLIGKRGEYQGKAEVASAYYVSHQEITL